MKMPTLTGFDQPPFLIPQEGGTQFQVWEECVYTARKGDSWMIPAGFRTDFATIPAAVSWAIAKLGAWTLAAIVHDLLCEGINAWHAYCTALRTRRGGPLPLRVPAPTANSVDADAIFYRIARDHGVDPITASLLWTGVRWGALFNKARRSGFMQTFWPWLGLSLAFAPILAPATILAVVGRSALWVVRQAIR